MKLFTRAVKFLCPTFHGGGSGGGNTTSTVNQRNIPPELAPYYELLLNASVKQAFSSTNNPDPNPSFHVGLPKDTTFNDAMAKQPANAPQINNVVTGMKSYAGGGEVRRFDTAGAVPAPTTPTTTTATSSADNMAADIKALGDITGVMNYSPIGGVDSNGNWDASKSVADLDPLQNYAAQAVANLQTPSLEQAKGMLDTSAENLSTQSNLANQYGDAGYNAGQAAASIGQKASDIANVNATTLGNTALGVGVGGGKYYGQMGSDYGALGANAGVEAGNLGISGGNLYGSLGATYGQNASDLGMASGALGVSQGNQVYGAGADLANRAANSGQQYANDATNAKTVASYMNPYVQDALNPQLALLQQQNDITKQKNNSAAAQASAYGGSRQAVQNALTDQGNALAAANLIGQGYNTAYDKAQQNILQGSQLNQAGLGLANQSLNTALQGTSAGISGLNQAISGQQAGMQGAQTGLQGVGTQLSGIDRTMAGYGLGQQGANIGLSGVGTALSGVNAGINAGQYGLSGSNTGINAQQAAMQGAQTGLSGVGAATNTQQAIQSGAVQRANVQGQDLTNQLTAANAQNTMGQQLQAHSQQIIDNAIAMNDYQQNRPYNILAQFGNMLNGVNTGNVTEFKPAGNPLAQNVGTLATVLGAVGANKKEGGVIKLAEGGQVGGVGDLAVYNALNGIG